MSELRDTIDVLINTLKKFKFAEHDMDKLLDENDICKYCFYGREICDCQLCYICTKPDEECKCVACNICWFFPENCKCRENKPK